MGKNRWYWNLLAILVVALISSTTNCTTSYTTPTDESNSLPMAYSQSLPTEQPFIHSFTATPKTISSGQSTTLNWNVSGATTVTIHPIVGDVSSSGTRLLALTTTTAYTLTATNEAGSSTSTTTVTVQSSAEPSLGYDPVTGRNQSIDFAWEQLCLSEEYQVQIAKDAGFALIVFDSGTYAPASSTSPALIYPAGGTVISPSVMGSSTPSPPSGLEAGHTYYWRVRVRQSATGQSILSPWSEVGTFTIEAGLPSSTPHLGIQPLSPHNSLTSYPVKPISFSWSPLKGTTRYQFVLAKDAALTDVIAEAEVTTTAYEYEGTLDYSTSYYWQVMALEPAPSDWSATFSFQTETAPRPPPPAAPPPVTPLWVWVIIGIGTILITVTLTLIFNTRRV